VTRTYSASQYPDRTWMHTPLKPQSLESIRRSGSMYSRHRRIKEATSSGRSICIVRWLITPTAIFLSFDIKDPK
jgi:hypothetical protein